MKWLHTTTVITTDQTRSLTDQLNDFGEQGWELVTLIVREEDTFIAAFKKPRE